jgi:serine-type D-Ala-D-Ala carboxypeptidase (penicillin-binding protein 5/6)
MKEEIRKRQVKELFVISFSVTTLFLILLGIFIFAQSNLTKHKQSANAISSLETEEIIEKKIKKDPFSEVKISAYGAYVKDLNSGKILYTKNAKKQLPLASLTKVSTALATKKILDNSDLIEIKSSLLLDDYQNFISGEHFRLKDLIDFTLISSSNSGAEVLAFTAGYKLNKNNPRKNFIEYMNGLMTQIGLNDTKFKNPTGLDENGEQNPGAIGTAEDIAKLFEYILKNEPTILEATKNDFMIIKSKEGFEHNLKNTNEIVASLPNTIGSKTGYTEVAGGNLAVVIDPALNNPIVIVVLGSSKEGRFKDVERLSNATLDYFLSQE